MQITDKTKFNEIFFRRLRRYAVTETDRDNLEEVLEDLRSALLDKGVAGDNRTAKIPMQLRELASTCLYEIGSQVSIMPMERLPQQEHMKNLDGLELSKKIDELRKSGDSLNLNDQRQLIMLKDEFKLRKFNTEVDNRKKDIEIKQALSEQQENNQSVINAKQNYESLLSIDSIKMSIEDHKQHFIKLSEAAHLSKASVEELESIKDRQIVEGMNIYEYEVGLHLLEHRRDPFNKSLDAPVYDVHKDAALNMDFEYSEVFMDQEDFNLLLSDHVEEQRSIHNSNAIAGDHKYFNEQAITNQFTFECRKAKEMGISPVENSSVRAGTE